MVSCAFRIMLHGARGVRRRLGRRWSFPAVAADSAVGAVHDTVGASWLLVVALDFALPTFDASSHARPWLWSLNFGALFVDLRELLRKPGKEGAKAGAPASALSTPSRSALFLPETDN